MIGRRIVRWAGLALLVCLGLIVLALGVMTTPWFKERVRDLVVRRASALIDGEIDVERVTGSLYRDVTLHGIAIRQGGDPAVHIRSLTARYDLVQLVAGRFSLDALEVAEPHLRVVEGRDGWNIRRLIRTRERQPDAAPWSIAIRRLVVTGGTVRVEPRGRGAETIADLSLEAALTYTPAALDITIRRLSAQDARTGLRITSLTGGLSFDDQGYAVKDLVLSTPASNVRGQAAYHRARDATIGVDLDLELAPLASADVRPYLTRDVSTGVVLWGRATATGPLDALRVGWKLDTQVGMTSGTMTLGLDRRPAVRFQGRVDVTHLDLAPLTRRASLGSQVTATADLRGTFNTATLHRSRLEFSLRAPHVALLGYEARAVTARGVLDGTTVRATGEGQAYGAQATFDATLARFDDTRARHVTAAGHVRAVDLRALPTSLRAPAIATSISGQYAVAVAHDRWRAEITAEASRVVRADIASGTRVTAESEPGRFMATVDGAVTGVDHEMLGLTPDRQMSLGGTIQGRVTTAGLSAPIDLATIDAAVVANLAGSTITGVRLDTADVDLSIGEGLADVRRLDVGGLDVAVSAKGTLALAGEGHQSDLAFRADVADLGTLAVLGLKDTKGVLHAEGKIEGRSSALAAAGTFNTHQLKVGNVVDALTLNGTFKVAVPNRDWSRLTADVEAESGFLTLRGYDVDRVALTSHYRAGQIDVDGRIEQKARTIELDTSLLFHPDHREVHLRQLSVAGPGAPWQLAAGTEEAVIQYGPETASIEGLIFTRDQERVEASGLLSFSDARQSELKMRFRDIQVGDIYTMAFGHPVVTGVATGEVDVAGTLQRPLVTATLQVAGGRVADVAYASAAADVTFRERRLSIDGRIVEPGGSAFTITGVVPVGSDAGAIDVQVQSPAVSLGLIQAFTSHLTNVEGRASVDLHATGSLTTPSLSGTVAVIGGGFLVTASGVTYRDLQSDIQFEGQRALIKQFRMSDDEGHVLTMSGGADVFTGGKDRAFEIAIEARGLQVVENEYGDVEADIQIRAEGGLAAPRLTGRIAMDQGRLEVDEILRRVSRGRRAPSELRPDLLAPPVQPDPATAPDAAVAAEAPAVEAQPVADTGLFSRATLDLDIHIPDALVLRGRDVRAASSSMALGNVNLTIGGDLDLMKSPGMTPVVRGSLGVVRGFYDFQGRRFQVTRGSTVSFRGADSTNPTLNVTGERLVQGVTARVQVTGSLRRPRLALSSNPPLDEGDVLSLIVFNQPINQLGEGEQVDLLERAGSLAVGTLATSLSSSIGRALDVDLFEIRAPGSNTAGELNVGRQLNERLFVGFQQEFAGGEASRLSVEYQLTDAFRIMTSVAQGVERAKRSQNQDTAGIDLIYQVRY